MLELSILGFLYETPLHGYELRKRITALTGHVRPVGESTLYPAIKRLEKAGLLVRETRPGPAAAPRQVLTLTPTGREELRRRLADADGPEVTDENRWFTLLAFLRHLDDPAAQAAVLRRRLAFLEEPASFFYDGERPLRAEDLEDPFRHGILTIARATTQAELTWLHATLTDLESTAAGGFGQPLCP
ncbi:PadR family transcriptional regulator [Streptomyces sp. NPDC016562]|uniref:PadR family transcriptional regulator n=1 Tax=Streptomyces sp. NPDC016562 TaxID=3364966 RepID=UPI0036FA8D0C